MSNEKPTVDELLKRGEENRLSPSDVDYIIEKIENSSPGNDSDLVGFLFTLGTTKQSEYDWLVEKFLIYPSNSMVSMAALWTLSRWDLREKYINEIKMFIKGVEWDQEDVRIAAIYSAGDYLRKNIDMEVLKLLVDFFEGLGENPLFKKCDSEERTIFLKKCAYESIAYALSEDPSKINSEIDPKIIELAHQFLEDYSGD